MSDILIILYTHAETPLVVRKQFVQDLVDRLLRGLPFETSVRDDMMAITIMPPILIPGKAVEVSVHEFPYSMLSEE